MIKRLLLWIVLLCMAVQGALAEAMVFTPLPTTAPTPVPTAEPVQSAPTVRVWLKRQALTDRADLTLTCDYSARLGNGTQVYLPAGTEATVVIRNGQLVLFARGMSMTAGNELTLQRGGEGGLTLETGGNLFPGDLWLSIRDGMLYPILTLSVEEYLKGVVPYEMSDSYPLEALKAQAVCARTYALARLDKTRPYDLVDTTDDQVFLGVNAGNVNAIRAVQETAGVVGVYGGRLAVCYYSASNGGQTDTPRNVWGTDVPYYAVTDDPYDLENPESVLLRCRLMKQQPQLPEAFKALMLTQLAEPLRNKGYAGEPEAFRVDSILELELEHPRYAEPNRLYTLISVLFSFSACREVTPASTLPDGTVIPASYGDFEPLGTARLNFDLFPEAIRALGLSIYGADNELVTLEETEDSFLLTSRRYGHGVGMSQRGAQTMAGTYGMNYAQILAFYYPGMELGRTGWGPVPAVTPDPVIAATPGPSATPTPRPTLMPVSQEAMPEGAWLASVEGIDDDSSLNLRAAPNGAAQILRRLYKHQQLIVLEKCEEDGWVRVRTDSIEGYVMERFLEGPGFEPDVTHFPLILN